MGMVVGRYIEDERKSGGRNLGQSEHDLPENTFFQSFKKTN